MANRNHVWKDSEIDFVRQHYGRIPVGDIASALGVSVSAVQSRAFAHGIKAPPKKAAASALEVRELKAQGLTVAEIAERLSLSRGQVDSRLYRTRCNESSWKPSPRPAWSAERTERLIQMIKKGYSPKVIAAELGVSVGAIRSKARKMGLVLPVGYKSYSQEDIDLAYQMKAAGMTNAQIAEKLDDPPVSVNTVNRILVNESPSWEMV